MMNGNEVLEILEQEYEINQKSCIHTEFINSI